MISRKTAIIIAEVYEITFRIPYPSPYYPGARRYKIDTSNLYDFLFDNDHSSYFCNLAKKACPNAGTRGFKEFSMKLHTGESLVTATPQWSWQQRENLGPRYLRNLAEDILEHGGMAQDSPIRLH